ncbi:cytochrome c peroxidase [Pseudomonadota bacterium]
MPEAGEASKRRVRTTLTRLLLLLLLASMSGNPLLADPAEPADVQVLAPGWNEIEFEPPEAGSYQLPPIGMAGNGQVLSPDGEETTLHTLMGDKVVVLSFIYSSCSDANGCPLATHVLEKLQDQLLEDPSQGKGVRFISLSFDPVQDTPEVMKRYGRPYISGDFDWHFLTTSGPHELEPILESYGQSIVRDPNAEEGEAGSISHILRVFLVDRHLRIRNIFSASYLHADTMLNDILTLQMEPLQAHALQGPGDDKDGYETREYQTRAQSLERRKGVPASLWSSEFEPPLGLPPIPTPAGNPLTQEKIDLGRLLFFDRRLSHNNTFSCAMCHVPEQGFTSNELAMAVGIEGRTVRRNSPTIYNVAYLERLFHDGRESSLEQQIWGPLLAHNEMGNPSVGLVMEQIRSIPGYPPRFEQAFPGQVISMETLGQALSSYQRVLVSANSAFDRWYYGEEEDAMTAEQRAGFQLFTGGAGCSGCHLVGTEWALFTDNQLHNTGIGYQRSMSKTPESTRVQIAPGEMITVRGDIVADASEPRPNDLGLYEITEDPDDRWKYRTPTLRNIALTAPYMHDGSLSSLEDVIAFYNRGGIDNELRDPLIRPLGLNDAEVAQLLAFLEALTGDNVDTLVADAFTVPVGNTGSY